MNARTRAFRDDYARTITPRGYRGLRHALLVALAGGAMLAFAISPLRAADVARLWWLIPATFVLANLVEYFVHRHLMHRDTRLLHAMYVRHTLRHHRYFTHDDVELTGTHDLHAVLFPPVLLFFFSAVALGAAAAVALLLGRAAGLMFFALALAYYLAYEVLHLLAHWPRREDTSRSSWLRRLLVHHRLHHAPEVMARGNFNIVFPLGDRLFGTLRRECRDAAATQSTGEALGSGKGS
ncbi:MAG TPA: sterol desaturase family protein [Tahibacter sp.]|uniref:sterol desaturase family protein n=1 Tax=Tahibacter sp. TaxID=2056211 RepID=UPI002B821E99|nr:sterol desaturase family protein [Tahibacter sp.]HSX61156.1 sterol desaturase family protein [Tahibacter sp.]